MDGIKEEFSDLHYTLLLLILKQFSEGIEWYDLFTLHFATINTAINRTAMNLCFNLHYTLLLLIQENTG